MIVDREDHAGCGCHSTKQYCYIYWSYSKLSSSHWIELICGHPFSFSFLCTHDRFEDLWSYWLQGHPGCHSGSLRRETNSETGRPSYYTCTVLPIPLHRHRHVYTQQQSRKRELRWGSPSARVPFFPSRHGSRPTVNRQPSAQPRLIFPWCSAVSTSGLPSRLREPQSRWTGAAGQIGGAKQVSQPETLKSKEGTAFSVHDTDISSVILWVT